eukprot:m.194891 g.194891  ORF g.194891 m.194891 type:complete len:170 (-) comp18667_c0_seq1:1166-1675(-)
MRVLKFLAVFALVVACAAGKKGEKGMSESETIVGDEGADRVSGEARFGSAASADSAFDRVGDDAGGKSDGMGKKSGMGKKGKTGGMGKKGGKSDGKSGVGKGKQSLTAVGESSEHVRTTAAAAGAAVLIAATAFVVIRRARMQSGYTAVPVTERTPLCAELREPDVLLE